MREEFERFWRLLLSLQLVVDRLIVDRLKALTFVCVSDLISKDRQKCLHRASLTPSPVKP